MGLAGILSWETWSHISAYLELATLLRVSESSLSLSNASARGILVFMPLQAHTFQRVLKHFPKAERVERILEKGYNAAHLEGMPENLMDAVHFENIVRIQLCLQRVVATSSTWHTSVGMILHQVLEVLRASGSHRWQRFTSDEMLLWLVQDCDISQDVLETDVTHRCISHIHTIYRKEMYNRVDLGTLLELILGTLVRYWY